MRKAILFLCLSLAACDTPISNDEIIAETQKCRDANMRTAVADTSFTGLPTRIICYPKVGE